MRAPLILCRNGCSAACWGSGGFCPELALTAESLEVKLLRGLSIAGTVRLADGRAVLGANVWLVPLREDAQVNSPGPLSRREGRFRLQGLRPGKYQVFASAENPPAQLAPGVQELRAHPLSGDCGPHYCMLTNVEAGASDVEPVLAAPVVVTSKVVDSIGQAIPAFNLEVSSLSTLRGMEFYEPYLKQDFAGEDGAFSLELPARR